MDQLSTLQNSRADVAPPTEEALGQGRARLAQHMAGAVPDARANVSRHPLRRTFLALGAVAAAVVVIAVVVTNLLGVGAWHQHGVSAPATSSPIASPAPAPAPTFTLPTDCAAVGDSGPLTGWSAGFGETTLLDGGSFRVPDTDQTGLHCVWGSPTGPTLTITVGTIDSAPGGRARQEATQRKDASAEEEHGGGTLFIDPPQSDPNLAGLTLVTDSAIIAVGTRDTTQSSEAALSYARAWLDEVAVHTGAAATIDESTAVAIARRAADTPASAGAEARLMPYSEWAARDGGGTTEMDPARLVWVVSVNGPTTFPNIGLGAPGSPGSVSPSDGFTVVIDATTANLFEFGSHPTAFG